MGNYRNYTNEDVIRYCSEVVNMSQLLRRLGLEPKGGNFRTMKKLLFKLEIDTCHWTGRGWNKGKQLKDFSDYSRAVRIKPHLIKKRGHVCEECHNDTWLDVPITLEIHHIDGHPGNNQEDNLQLLCPNCHSYTDYWRGKNKVTRD